MAYIRVSKAHPEEPQRTALASVGLTDPDILYVDIPPKRRKAEEAVLVERGNVIRACRAEGDEVWIAAPGVWATSPKDAAEALAALTRQRGTLCVVGGQRYVWHPDAADALELVAAIAADNQRASTAAARASAAARRERKDADDAAAWKQAKALWPDYPVSVVEISKRTGIPLRTLYRRLGPRGNEPFTGKPKAKKKARR